jgi:hypothetical protein
MRFILKHFNNQCGGNLKPLKKLQQKKLFIPFILDRFNFNSPVSRVINYCNLFKLFWLFPIHPLPLAPFSLFVRHEKWKISVFRADVREFSNLPPFITLGSSACSPYLLVKINHFCSAIKGLSAIPLFTFYVRYLSAVARHLKNWFSPLVFVPCGLSFIYNIWWSKKERTRETRERWIIEQCQETFKKYL